MAMTFTVFYAAANGGLSREVWASSETALGVRWTEMNGEIAEAECLICRQLDGQSPVPGGLIPDGEHFVVFHVPPAPGRPIYAGHLLVVVRRHTPDFASLTEEEARPVGVALSRYSAALKRLGATRVYVATVGHGVDHLHVHLIPRWPEVPDDVPWIEVDEWEGAPRLAADDVAPLMERLKTGL